MNAGTNNRQLARADGAELAPQNAPPAALDYSQIDPEIMARAAAIAADVMANKGTITPAQALAAAFHFAATGEIYGRHSYVGTSGPVAGKVIEGYRGVTRELDMSRYQYRYRPLTDEEKSLHEIAPIWQALACEIDVLAARSQCIRMGVPYQPVVGIGILKPTDKQNREPPKTKTWYWVLQKRARVDALRQLGENVTADEVLDEAGVEAPEGARLSVEQAEALVASKQITARGVAEHDAKTDAEKQADIEAQQALNLLRKLDERNVFDGGPCSLCGAPEKAGHTSDCGFRVLYPKAKVWTAPNTSATTPAAPFTAEQRAVVTEVVQGHLEDRSLSDLPGAEKAAWRQKLAEADALAQAEPEPAEQFAQMPGATQERAAQQAQPATLESAPVCHKCGGAMWDNRTSKQTEAQPDFKCKNKTCGGAIWIATDTQRGINTLHKWMKQAFGESDAGDAAYRAWLAEKFGKESSKDLTPLQMGVAIAVLRYHVEAQQQPAQA